MDLLIETAAGQLIGIEIKATATVATSDARHLIWLRDQAGDAFAAEIVLHTGPHAFPISDRIVAAPVSASGLTYSTGPVGVFDKDGEGCR